MFVYAKVRDCDVRDIRYPEFVDGLYALARGATGRWCAVMSFGPEVCREQGLWDRAITVEQARSVIETERVGDWLDL